jgi:hypothetical protein
VHQNRRGLLGALCLATGIFIASANTAHAAPVCASDTLEAYIALGSCEIDSFVFSDFALLGIPFGATPIPADQVTVNPLNDASGVGLEFLLDVSASSGDFLDVSFGYNVAGAFSSAALAMTGATATDDGSVTAIKNFCVDAPFSFSCPALIVSAFDPGLGLDDLLETTAFTTVLMLGIIDDIAVDGTFGTAALSGSVANQFGRGTVVAPIPEPSTLLLVGSGLGLALRRRWTRRNT